MGVDLDGQNAHDVVVQAHQALHLLHGSGGGVGAQQGVVALAVFIDLLGHGFHAPILVINDFAAIVRKYGAEMFDKTFGLRVGQILARDKDMLV